MKIEIGLSRDSWHYRLQHTIFDRRPHFQNFCPYFWLTIFCVLAAPFYYGWQAIKVVFFFMATVLGRIFDVVVAPFDYVARSWLKYIDSNVCMPIQQKAMTSWDKRSVLIYYRASPQYYMDRHKVDEGKAIETIYFIYSHDEKRLKEIRRCGAKFRLWKKTVIEEGKDWKVELSAIKKMVEAEDAEQGIRDIEKMERALALTIERDRNKKKKMANLAAWTQKAMPILLLIGAVVLVYVLSFVLPIAWHLLTALVLGIGTIVSHILGWFVSLRPYGIARFLFWFTIQTVVVSLLIYFLIRLRKKCDFDLKPYWYRFQSWIDPYMMKLFLPLEWFVEFCRFVVEYVKLFKKDYCPNIVWSD